MNAYDTCLANTDNLIRQNFAVLYPGIIDPERVSEIRPEEFEAVSQFASDANEQIIVQNSQKKSKIHKIFNSSEEWLDKHPTIKRGIYVAGISALCMATLVSAMYQPFSQNARAQNIIETDTGTGIGNSTANVTLASNITQPLDSIPVPAYGFSEFIAEGRIAVSDNYLNITEMESLRTNACNVYQELIRFNNTISNDVGANLEQILGYSREATRLSNERNSVEEAHRLLNNLNLTVSELGEAGIKAESMLKNLTAENLAIGRAYEGLQQNISVFKKIFNVADKEYRSSHGEEILYNLLATLEEPAVKNIPSKEHLLNQTSNADINMRSMMNLLSQNLTHMSEDGKYMSINNKEFVLPANALAESLNLLEHELANPIHTSSSDKYNDPAFFWMALILINAISTGLMAISTRRR